MSTGIKSPVWSQVLREMPCALEVIDTRLQSTSHIRCNRSFDRNICCHFSKDHLIRKPVSDRPENRDTTLTLLPLGHDSDWKPAPFLSDIQEVNKAIPLTSGDPGIEGQTAQPRILCCLGQPNEGNMHDQADSSEPVSNGNPHGGSTLRQSRQRKNVCNALTACPPCHVVAKKLSSPVTATLLSDSDVLHDDDKPPKRSPRKKGNKKGKQYKGTAHKKLNLASEITFEDNTYGVSPVEVLPTNLPADKLSETTSSASSLVKEAHMEKHGGENNNAYVESVTMMNLSTLGTDEMDGSDCAGSSNNTVGGRLSCSFAPYLNDETNTTDSLEFDGSTFTEHGLGEESSSYQKSTCACVYEPDRATTDYFFSRWNNDINRNYSPSVEARLTIKDENSHDHLHLGPSTGVSNGRTECQLLGSHLSATHAEDTNDPLVSRSCSSKDVTGSCIHNERVQCSNEACSSKPSLQVSSGRRTGKSRKTPSYSDLNVSNRVKSAIRRKNNGRDISAVWQKVERNGKVISKGHSGNSPIQDKGAHEDNNKGVQEDPTKLRAKHNQNRKPCKHESPNGTVELECTKEEEEAFSECQTFSRPIYKKQSHFLRQQRSSSSKQGSQLSKNYYAPRNGISKVPKVYFQQEESPMLQLVHAVDTGDRISNSCSADEVLTGVGDSCPNEGNESSQSGMEIAASVSCNLVPDLPPQAASDDAHISDPHSLCPENKGTSTGWSSKNLCTDPCAADTDEAWHVKQTVNNSQESYKWYSAAGHLSQKWVPVGKKETSNVIHLDVQEALIVEDSVQANDISYSVGPLSANGEDSKLANEMNFKLNSPGNVGLECRAHNGTVTDYGRIKEAINYVYAARQQVEDVHLRIGRPIADFEQFVQSASPVVHCNRLAGSKSYLQECVKDGLRLHQTPEITLDSVWQWYEEPCCYGLEVKAQDFHRSKDLSSNHCQSTTYFVPYLSAVQLFAQPTSSKEETSPHLNLPPIFAKLLPQQSNSRNRPSTLCTEDNKQHANGELIFEFFESEQPYWRRQLFDKVNELIVGVKPLNCQISGDPKSLELSLHELHPASWFCVAWYPIYRIPDGKFQAAFLTYHSLGHWTHRSSGADRGAVLPVIGLQSYNDKAERWFEMSKLDSSGDGETTGTQRSEASEALKQRVRTLNEAAAAMSSRGSSVVKQMSSRNRHPDYEFFLSRCRADR